MPSTFSSLLYHFIFGTKLRQRYLNERVIKRMHEYLGGCIRTLGGTALEVGGVEDHVHALALLKPTHCVSDVLREIKRASSLWMHNEIGDRAFHWQDGFSVFTVSRSQIGQLRHYIANQAEHHKKKTFEEEYRALLEAHGIAFDERFLL